MHHALPGLIDGEAGGDVLISNTNPDVTVPINHQPAALRKGRSGIGIVDEEFLIPEAGRWIRGRNRPVAGLCVKANPHRVIRRPGNGRGIEVLKHEEVVPVCHFSFSNNVELGGRVTRADSHIPRRHHGERAALALGGIRGDITVVIVPVIPGRAVAGTIRVGRIRGHGESEVERTGEEVSCRADADGPARSPGQIGQVRVARRAQIPIDAPRRGVVGRDGELLRGGGHTGQQHAGEQDHSVPSIARHRSRPSHPL